MGKRYNRSKYKFSTLEVGDTFKVEPLDFQSMKNSLYFHNRNHNKNVEVEVVDEEKIDGNVVSITVKRTS